LLSPSQISTLTSYSMKGRSFGKSVLRKISLTDPSVFVIDDYDQNMSATSSCSEEEDESFDPDMTLIT